MHPAWTPLAQQALDTLDGIAFAVEQIADAAQQVDVFGPVIAASAAAFQGPDLAELAFPKPQDVLRNVEFPADFADRTKGCCGFSGRATCWHCDLYFVQLSEDAKLQLQSSPS